MEKRYSRYNINIQYTSCNRLIGFPVFKQTSETRDIIRTMGGKHGGWGVGGKKTKPFSNTVWLHIPVVLCCVYTLSCYTDRHTIKHIFKFYFILNILPLVDDKLHTHLFHIHIFLIVPTVVVRDQDIHQAATRRGRNNATTPQNAANNK